MSLVSQMIREPKALADECVRGESLDRVVKGSLLAIVLGTALFGAVLGGTRGGLQVAYSAIKLPLALLSTLVISTPAFHAFAALAGKPMPLRAGSALVLASLARASLALLALSPILWLVVDVGFGYHASIELAVMLYATAGLAAVSVIVRGLDGARFRGLATLGFLAVFLPVFAQTAWVLRPYAGRPSQDAVPFLRSREGSFTNAVATSASSMLGVYERDEAELYEAEMRARDIVPPYQAIPTAPLDTAPATAASPTLEAPAAPPAPAALEAPAPEAPAAPTETP